MTGPDLRALAAALRGREGVDQVVPFGTALHVNGRDAAKLNAAIGAVRDAAHQWTQVRSSLEDVFIKTVEEKS